MVAFADVPAAVGVAGAQPGAFRRAAGEQRDGGSVQGHRAVGRRVGRTDRRPDLRGEIERRLALELVEIRDRTSVRALVDEGPAREPDRVDELELAVGNPQHVRQLGG